jgi:hypothetical protein
MAAAAAAAAAAAGDSSGAGGALPAAANDSDFEAADESEPGSEDFDSSSDEEEQTKPARKKAARGSGAAPKAAPKPRKQAKAKAKAQPKEKAVPRIGTKKAKKLYMLDDADLAKMKDVKTKGSMWGESPLRLPLDGVHVCLAAVWRHPLLSLLCAEPFGGPVCCLLQASTRCTPLQSLR